MNSIFIPQGYKPVLNEYDTQRAISYIKDTFQDEFSSALNLKRVSAPLFVTENSGLNDNLNGYERPVSFDVPAVNTDAQVVHSLAKWKRLALKKYNFSVGDGLYTDMNAIRRDEELDNLHSVYVDQWDWEQTITHEQRTTDYLHYIVESIYEVLKELGNFVNMEYKKINIDLPDDIYFITSQQLEELYPYKSPKERERLISSKHKAVFIEQIGGRLRSGQKHDGRSPDYDDWNLNGDIILWNDVLQDAFEISSMGIRVDAEAMYNQLIEADAEERRILPFHVAVLNDELPYSIGGGIGQSRLCMYFLKKAHIGEVQASVWPDEMIADCMHAGIFLL